MFKPSSHLQSHRTKSLLARARSNRFRKLVLESLEARRVFAGFEPVRVMDLVEPTGRHVAVADMNGDGFNDIVASFAERPGIWEQGYVLFENDGLDQFPTSRQIGANQEGSQRFLLRDMDRDGDIDILSGGFEVGFLRNDGQGGFPNTNLSLNLIRDAIETADFDRDGFLDVVTAHWTLTSVNPDLYTKAVYVHINNDGDGTFTRTLIEEIEDATDPFGFAVDVGDFNNDNIVDLIYAAQDTDVLDPQRNGIWLLAGVGDGTFLPSVQITDRPARHLEAFDLDQLNFEDIVAASNTGLYMVLSTPLGGFTPPSTIAAANGEYYRLDLADLNRDGSVDIVAADYNNMQPVPFGWFEQSTPVPGDPPSFQFHAIEDRQDLVSAVVGDVDNSNFVDLVNITALRTATNQYNLSWYRNNINFQPTADTTPTSGFPDIDIPENTLWTVDLKDVTAGGSEDQPLRITATSSDQTVIANQNVTVNYTSPNTTATISLISQPGLLALPLTTIITVLVEDGGLDRNLDTPYDNAFLRRAFQVTVIEANDAPTDILLNDEFINENAGLNAVVGVLSTVDPDPTDTHTYQFASGLGDDDNALFAIVLNNVTGEYELIAKPSFNFEVRNEYYVRIRTTDDHPSDPSNRNLSFEKTFTIVVNDINEAPTNIILNDNRIDENAGMDALVGTLSSVDEDQFDTHTYTLVSGAGDTDNTLFWIDNLNKQLYADDSFNFEVKQQYLVRIRSTDANPVDPLNPSLFFEKTFTIFIDDVNDRPSDIRLVPDRIKENSPPNTTIGVLVADDEDFGDTHTFEEVSGPGDDDNALFEIVVNGVTGDYELVALPTFNYEVKSSYTIRIRATDSNTIPVPNLWLEKVITVFIDDVNDAPTDIFLVDDRINENAGPDALVGILSTVDEDPSDTHTYSLPIDPSFPDNALFRIVGDQLLAIASFNYEVRNEYLVLVRTTDNNLIDPINPNLSFEKTFTIFIDDVNDAPSDILLDDDRIYENAGPDAVVGVLSAIDEDPLDTHTFSLPVNALYPDNTLFEIVGNELRTRQSFNYEVRNTYLVLIRTTDSNTIPVPNLSFDKTFTIFIDDVNDRPSDILLNDNRINENSPVGALVGVLSTIDEDPLDTHAYSLVSGVGGLDNGLFEIVGNELRARQSFNFEVKSLYFIRIRTTDNNLIDPINPNLSLEKTFTIFIDDVNDRPTDISLNPSTIYENMRRDALVGTLSTTDEDSWDSHSYTLVGGTGSTDNGLFNILGNRLRANESFDYEAGFTYYVRIRSTDRGGLWVEKPFVITILNQDPEIRPVKDILPGTGNSNPESFVNVNGILYFVADDGTSGSELWRSDSTSAGTVRVRDIFPGANGSAPRYLTNINGTLYFTANDGASGVELWKSDGTSAGTVRVRDLRPGAPSSYPRSLTNVNGTLYFSANDGVAGTELWSTDGTIAGTALVKDIGLGGAGSMPRYLTNVSGTLFFRANDGTNGYELWKSDGTNANTVLMRDIREGYGGSSPQYLTNVNGTLFFTADDDANGRELWKSDGTVAGTFRVKDVWAGANSSVPGPLTNVNGTLFFTADDGVNGRELWTSNGTSTGTRLVRDIFPSAGNSYPGNFENISGILYFRASDGVNGFELWKSDGTTAGTVMVRDLSAGGGSSYPRFLESAQGKLYFSASDGTGFKLWSSNGTTSGTVLAGTIVFNPIGNDPTYLMNVSGKLYFSAMDPLGEYGRELWVLELDHFSPSSEPPLGIEISSSAIDENAGANAPVGILSTTDSGYENTFSYSLVAGSGDSDNADFLIDGTTLRAVKSLNFEAKASYSIRVRSTDQTGLFTEREFSISVINIEEAPVLTRGGSSLSGNVLTTFTNIGTWIDPEGDTVTLSTSLGTVVKNTDGTWAWSFVPSQAYTQQIVTIDAIDDKGLVSQVEFTMDSLVATVNSKVYHKGSAFANHGVNAALDASKVVAKSVATTQALTFANLVNTTRGINGLVFDVAGLATSSLTPADFVFRMSPTGLFNEGANPPSSWLAAPSPTLVDVTAGTSTAPARIRLEWPDNAIANRWLQIQVLANANTGLLAPQVYYIGHLQGETNGAIEGNAFRVRGNDMTALVAAINSGVTVPVDNIFDLDKDGRVRGTDSAAALASVGRSLTRITIPASGSAEEGEGDATRASVAAPSVELSKHSTVSDDSRRVEIRARLTDELFGVLPAAASGPGVASAPFATGQAAGSAATSALSMDLQLPSLDEYFDRLGRGPRSGGLRNR